MTTRGRHRHILEPVDTAAVLGNAMTDYVLAVGAKTAPAARAPEHMAEWLAAHGYRIVRVPADIEPGDLYDADLADRIGALIDRRSCCRDDAERCSILRQVLAAGATRADVRRVA
jgi:hypothetical protein